MPSDILIPFGNAIRKLRNEAGVSQEVFADMCDLHRTYISDVELGKRNVSLENIKRIADALGIKVSDIFLEVESDESI